MSRYETSREYYDEYIPILNEPMGNDFNPNNFELTGGTSSYEYSPLSYKTNSQSYLDSWNPLPDNAKIENMKIKPKTSSIPEKKERFFVQPEIDDRILVIILIIILGFVLILVYTQNRHIAAMNEIMQLMIEHNSK